MISQTAEYALRAAVWLASRPDTALTTQQIADGTDVPASYLAKVLQHLGRAGLVRSQRGLGGGFVLTRSPHQVTVLDVVSAVDPIQRIEKCPLDLSEHRRKLCPLHYRLDAAAALIEDAFRSCTLAALLAEPGPDSPLCAVPRPRPARRGGRAAKTGEDG